MINLEIARPIKVALAHSDARREIYDPERILDGLEKEGPWYAHHIMRVTQQGLKLGNHFHEYWETFFTPTGGFTFGLVDIDNPENRIRYVLEAGQRIVLPPRVGHIDIGEVGAVKMAYGNVIFDPRKLISFDKLPNEKEVLKALESLL